MTTNRVASAARFFWLVACLPNFAFAQVVITEVMYDPTGADTGSEWIEVYNQGSASIPLTQWRVFESGTNHKITAFAGGNILAPNSYAIIAPNPTNFKNTWPNISGQLFKSSFNLSNAGETIQLKDASSSVADTVIYDSSMGGAGDGNSLNKQQGDASLTARAPSPGAARAANVIPPPTPKVTLAKAKTSTKKTSNTASSAGAIHSNIISTLPGDPATQAEQLTETSAAAAAPTSNNSYLWWMAAALLALLAAASIVVAKRFGKNEWDIVEETAE